MADVGRSGDRWPQAGVTDHQQGHHAHPPRHDKVVRSDIRTVDGWYSEADRSFVAETLRRNLRYDFGYSYH